MLYIIFDTTVNDDKHLQAWRTVLWDHKKYGPDLYWERDLAMAVIMSWYVSVRNREDKSQWRQPIVHNLATMGHIFNGYGQHTASDVCHEFGLFPLMPSWVLCGDEKYFTKFLLFLLSYSAKWHSKAFMKSCAISSNTKDPFHYNYHAAYYYLATVLRVYRRKEVRVTSDFYLDLSGKGLLDFNHIIGKFIISANIIMCHQLMLTGKPYYPPSGGANQVSMYKFLPIYQLSLPNVTAYTVIQARPPVEWRVGTYTKVCIDFTVETLIHVPE